MCTNICVYRALIYRAFLSLQGGWRRRMSACSFLWQITRIRLLITRKYLRRYIVPTKMSWHVCRICLADDNKTYTIADTKFQDIYEKITGYKWARDDRPMKICYICKSQLQRSLKFQLMSKSSEETFAQILAVGFEFTEEILPIFYKRRLQTVEIEPVSTVIIEPTKDIKIKEEIKETGTQETSDKTFSISPISIGGVGNKESSCIKLHNLGNSPVKNNTFFYVYDGYINCDADEVKEEIKNVEDISKTEECPEQIFNSRKEDLITDFQKKNPYKNVFFKSPPFNKNAFLYIPTPVITDFGLDEKYESNHMHKTNNITPKNEAITLTNECHVSFSTPKKDIVRKSLKLTFKRNDIITPIKSLGKHSKQTKVTHESSKRNGIIEELSIMDYNKSFTKKGQFLEKYIESKTEENKFTCNICTRSFNMKFFLNLHMKIHNGDRAFECDKCPKTYTRLHYLNRHKVCHLPKKSFICKICNKVFNQLSNLNQHKRTHTGERPYPCKLCNKRFIQLSHLLQHDRFHSGEKPYSCICGKRFSQKSGLLQHRRIHNIVQPFTYDICARGFNQKKT